MCRTPLAAFACACLAAATAFAQTSPSILAETTTKVSDHVWAIMGFPNIAIVVGSQATLVVDTGMGPRNGATIARAVAKLAPAGQKLYLTTTHFHPEHASGDSGFPAVTILIRNAAQQHELETNGDQILATFRSRDAVNKELLADVKLRKPSLIYDTEAALDLGGGVTIRLFWFGGAHTKGDELVFVDPDRTLVSGDVVQNKVIPNIYLEGGTPATWLAVLDKVAGLNALHVLPDHSAPGDGSLVAAEKDLISGLRRAALALKAQGISAADAGKQMSADFKTKHADWARTDVTAFVASIYSADQLNNL